MSLIAISQLITISYHLLISSQHSLEQVTGFSYVEGVHLQPSEHGYHVLSLMLPIPHQRWRPCHGHQPFYLPQSLPNIVHLSTPSQSSTDSLSVILSPVTVSLVLIILINYHQCLRSLFV